MKTIFVVDDSATNLMIANEMLKNTHKVLTIPTVEKMFKLIERILPDLILLDIEMPETNGFEAIVKLKSDERYKTIPVIFLTGNYDEQNRSEGLKLGAVDFLTKPFSSEKLLNAVSLHIGE